MTALEIILSIVASLETVLLIVLKYFMSKDKNKKEIKLAEIQKISDDYEDLKKRVEDAEKSRDEAKQKAQEALNKLETLKQAFMVISPYIKNAMEDTPESREAYTNFQNLIDQNQ